MKCKFGYLHAAIQIPGVFKTESTLVPEKIPGLDLDMRVIDGCEVVVITVGGHQRIVPLAAFNSLAPAEYIDVGLKQEAPKADKRTKPLTSAHA